MQIDFHGNFITLRSPAILICWRVPVSQHSSPLSPSSCPIDLVTAVFTPTDCTGLPEPLPKLDTEPVRIADFRPRVGLAKSWPPDDLDTLGLHIAGRLLH